ncbi:MAG: DUF6164 family protein [Lysobacterales bacterium]|jgi:hypothetical protein
MSTLLLNLRHVPDDEADEVRALLGKNRIGFFETQPSRWGVSAGAIWIADDDSVEEARRLMDAYQAGRQTRARAEQAAARRAGTAVTWWATMRDAPLRVLLVLLSIAFALALVALPVLLISW